MSTRITPAAHELLRDLHGAVAALEQARLALTHAYRRPDRTAAHVHAAEVLLIQREQAIASLAQMLVKATPQCAPNHGGAK